MMNARTGRTMSRLALIRQSPADIITTPSVPVSCAATMAPKYGADRLAIERRHHIVLGGVTNDQATALVVPVRAGSTAGAELICRVCRRPMSSSR